MEYDRLYRYRIDRHWNAHPSPPYFTRCNEIFC